MVAIAFSVGPLAVLAGSAAYALVMGYRLQDWRPALFITVLVMMAVHQTNEIAVYLSRGPDAALAGIGEYPETVANILASIGTVLLLRWVDQEQELAREFEERVQERTEELESFTYSASHDLRTPLRTINGFSVMLQEGYADRLDAEGQRYVHVIHESAQRMGQLIDDLLSLSRLGRRDMKNDTVDMEAVVEDVLSELRPTCADRALTVDVQPLPPAEGDRSMIRQVYANLLSNALKFTQEAKEARIEIGASAENGTTVYYVRDNGVGFDMSYTDKLFGVFERLHDPGDFEGTGVGLAIVDRIVRRHGGRVWAEGAEGEGATFYFTLPS